MAARLGGVGEWRGWSAIGEVGGVKLVDKIGRDKIGWEKIGWENIGWRT